MRNNVRNKGFRGGLLALFVAATVLFLTGCGGRSLAIEGSPASMGNVTVTLDRASAVRKTNPNRYEYSFRGTIENNSDEGIMEVIYTFSLLDENGNEFRSFADVYDGQNMAMPPHTKIPYSLRGVKWGAQDVPASVAIGISSVSTESELPPVRLPENGEYLYQALGDEKLANIKKEPPVRLMFHIDQGGYGRTATFETGDELARAVDLFCDIRIGNETGEMVTDNYNWICFVWADGTESYISINLRSLEFYAHSRPYIFELNQLNGFWSYASEYLTDD